LGRFSKGEFFARREVRHSVAKQDVFSGSGLQNFTACMKEDIEKDIANDFALAYKGILQLPFKARFGVYVAYKYYLSLFRKIRKTKPCNILEQRIRIPNYRKAMILVQAGVKNQLRMIG
jgi:phytoene/squalene synthetase